MWVCASRAADEVIHVSHPTYTSEWEYRHRLEGESSPASREPVPALPECSHVAASSTLLQAGHLMLQWKDPVYDQVANWTFA